MKSVMHMPGMDARERVAEHVRELIRRRGYPRGELLPSYRQLASDLDISYVTIKRGMDLLESQGVISCINGKGSFVNRELSHQGRALKSVGVIHLASHAHLFSAPYLTQIMRGINGGTAPLDVHIYTMREHGFVTSAQLAEHDVDGVILLGMEDEEFIREFAGWGIPGVVVDHVTAGVPLDFVACDNEAGVIRAVQHVVGLGHRHIRYLGNESGRYANVGRKATKRVQTFSSDFAERREAVRRALAVCPGVRYDEVTASQYPNPGEKGVADFFGHVVGESLGAAERPTAFLTDNDDAAVRLIREFAARGVAVPGDVSVCAVAKAAGESSQGDGITGSRFDFKGMGRKAVELLRLRCEKPGEAGEPGVYRVGFTWEEGRTCAARV